MSIVKVVNVIVVLDGGVSAIFAVLMRMIRVCHVFVCHDVPCLSLVDEAWIVVVTGVKSVRGGDYAANKESCTDLIGGGERVGCVAN
jgi:hypothetical protein